MEDDSINAETFALLAHLKHMLVQSPPNPLKNNFPQGSNGFLLEIHSNVNLA